MRLKSLICFLVALAIITTSIASVPFVLASSLSDAFKTQHMEVDFSNYVVNNTKNSGNTRFGAANDGVNISIDGDSDKYLHFSVSDQYLKRYYYCDRTALINPTGGTTADTSYPIDEGAKYRVTFDYQVSKAAGTGDVYVMVFSNTSYAVTSSSVTKNTTQLAKINLNSATASTKKDGWYTVTAEFTGPTATAKSSLGFAFLNPIENYEGNGATSYDSTTHNFPYDIKVDNIVVDRLGSAVLHYPNGTEDTIYGVPASTNDNMRLKSDGTTPNTDVYSVANAEKVGLPESNEWYSDAEFTDKVDSADFMAGDVDYYAQDAKLIDGAFKTQHMNVDFSKYVVNNTKNSGNTRFGATNDGVNISIDGDTDKYLHFSVSDQYLKRYYYCDRTALINPMGGTTADTSYPIVEGAKYRITFDYQVSKAAGTGDVYVMVFSNTSYAVTSSSVTKNTPQLAKINLDSATASTKKDGWYTATAEFTGPTATAKSSLGFAFLNPIENYEGNGATSYDSTTHNFPYDIKVDNVVVDRLGTAILNYSGGSSEKIYGVPASTNDNMYLKSDGTPNTDVYSTVNAEKINFPKTDDWYIDAEFNEEVDGAEFAAGEVPYYAQSNKVVDVTFKTQHMEVDFNDYFIINGNGMTGRTNSNEVEKNKGNTRFGVADDGASFAIEGTDDKYLQFNISDKFLNRYYYSDRAAIINPTGGITAGTSYAIVEAGTYRVTFDYKVTKAEDTGDLYALIYSNSAYTITNSTINSSTAVYAKIKLDSSTKSANKDGWYTATAEFVGVAAAKSTLAFAFVTSKTVEESGAVIGNNSNFPYGVAIDNVVADRLASAKIYYADGTKTVVKGAPVATNENRYLDTEKLYSEYAGDSMGLEGNWFEDAVLSTPVEKDVRFKPVENKHYYQEGYTKNAVPITPAEAFSGGEGTQNNPYLISTAEELALLAQQAKKSSSKKLTQGKYYKLTKDIVINEDIDKPKYSWITGTNISQTFDGTLDGDGHTISGLYIEDTNVLGGLFVSLGNGAVIKNLGIIDSYVETTNKVGVFASSVSEDNADSVQIIACYADESVIIDGNSGYAGGFIGYAGSSVELRYCYYTGSLKSGMIARAGASVGYAKEKLIIKSSYFAPGMTLDGTINRICGTVGTGSIAYNTYATNNTGISFVRVLVKDDMISELALENMPRFDFEKIWQTSDSTPTLRVFSDKNAVEPESFADPFDLFVYDDAKPGDVWSGGYSSSLKGSGTENDPYLISTAEDMAYLAKIVSEYRVINSENLTGGKYYKLTDDIYLNDVSDKNWTKNNPKQWIFGWTRDQSFNGYLDGAGHVVYGLYFDENNPNMYCSLLIAVNPGAEIKNLGVANSSIYNYSGYSSAITCGIKQMTSTKITTISSCFVASDVTIDSVSGTVGGILAGAGHAFTIKDCYSLASVTGGKNLAGTIFGHSWTYSYKGADGEKLPSKIINCYAMNPAKIRASGSVTSEVTSEYFYSNSTVIDLSEFIPQSKVVGDSAKSALVNFDFDNVWETNVDLSAGLRIFSTVPHKDTSTFYCTKPITTITFDTCGGEPVDSISGYPGDKLVLPTATRNADVFEEWHVYTSFDVPFAYDYFPEDDITLYAKYKVVGSDQDFENYEYTVPGMDGMDADYEWFGIGSSDFSSDYIHGGIHSLRRKGTTDNYQVASIANTTTKKLVVGNEYTLKMYVYLKESSAMDEKLILAYLKYPDWAYEIVNTQNICNISSLSKGEWKEITLNFVAASEYLGIVTPGNTNMFIDDITVTPTGKTGLKNDKLNGLYVAPGVKYETYEVPDDSYIIEDIEDIEDDDSSENTTTSTKKKYKVVKKVKVNKDNADDYTWIYIVGSIVVLLIIGGLATWLVLRKRKNNNNLNPVDDNSSTDV